MYEAISAKHVGRQSGVLYAHQKHCIFAAGCALTYLRLAVVTKYEAELSSN